MSGENSRARYSPSRTDTMIGSGARIAGDITFTGVLRVQGNVLGDVSCDRDFNGTIVVGESGSVTGTLQAPHIVVGGHVSGPAHSTRSLQVQRGASLVGDACYESIEVQAGGLIEGTLTPRMAIDGDRLSQEQRLAITQSPVSRYAMPPGKALPAGRRRLGWAIALLIGAVALVLVYRDPTPAAPPLAEVARKADRSAEEEPALRSASARGGGLRDGQGGFAEAGVSLAAGSDPGSPAALQQLPAEKPEMDPAQVVTIQGVNPGKPAGVFSVISREASVLLRKPRRNPSGGTRIELAKGATTSIAISRDEIFRVAEGRNLLIYYQGRKVGTNVIDSGVWMSFVPQSGAGAATKD